MPRSIGIDHTVALGTEAYNYRVTTTTTSTIPLLKVLIGCLLVLSHQGASAYSHTRTSLQYNKLN